MTDPVPDWAPTNIDLTKASAARMYDYYLGGAHNFGVDRELARKVLELYPDLPLIAQANRAFLHRAVRYLISQGIRQFIDIGSGIPTQGNVHETVLRLEPQARVLYVDHDSVAVVHSELILRDIPNTRVLQADLRSPADILAAPVVGELLDLSQPVAILMLAVLHFLPDGDHPAEVLRQFRDAVVPGSYLVMSHGTNEEREDQAAEVDALYRSSADPGVTFRTRAQIQELLKGWDLVDPGLVWAPEWRPDWPDDVGPDPASTIVATAVGRKS